MRAFRKGLAPGTDYGEHVHDVASLSVTLGGEYRESFADGEQVCGPLGLQLKPRGLAHTTSARTGAELFIVHLEDGALEEGALAGLGSTGAWLEAPGVGSALALACVRDGAAEPGVRRLVEHVRSRLRVRHRERPGWIEHAARRLSRELAHPPRLADLAEESGVHPVHFARVFRAGFGRSVDAWIRLQRVERGLRRLLVGEADVTSIAQGLGYYDQSHFGRDFRRETDWAPGRWRRAARAAGSGPSAGLQSS